MSGQNPFRWLVLLAVALTFAACGNTGGGSTVDANDFPDGPITLVVPSAAGAPIDAMARELAAALKPELDVPIVVSNKTGGSGIVAMSYTQQQPANGQTITLDATGITSVLQLQKAPFGVDDFQPVARVELDPFAFFVNKSSPYKTLEDFMSAAKKNPGKLSVGGYGTGSPHHIVAAKMAQAANVEYEWVPFASGSDAITALLGNHVDGVLSNASQIVRFGGEVRALVHSAEGQLPQAPEVPSFADVGFEKLTGYHWRGALVKDGTPEPIVERLHEAISAAVASDRFKKYLANVGNRAGTMSSVKEFEELIDSQKQADTETLKQLGLLD